MTAKHEYLLEFLPVGNAVKVSAVDAVTGTEVSIVGPANASEEQLSRVAIRKLEYVLARNRGDDRSEGGGDDGILV